jgi:hypothetical protein
VSSADARSSATDLMPSAAPLRAAQSAAVSRPFCEAFIPVPTDLPQRTRGSPSEAHKTPLAAIRGRPQARRRRNTCAVAARRPSDPRKGPPPNAR